MSGLQDNRFYRTLGAYVGAPPAPDARAVELAACYERIAQLEADLNECREFLEDQVDVIDGDYGEPAPNRAMQLVCMIDETLDGGLS